MNLKRLQKTIEKIGETLPPKDDWMPAFIVEDKKSLNVFGFVGDLTDNIPMKDACAEQMTRLIVEYKPDAVCFVTTAWSIDPKVVKEMSELEIEMVKSGAIRPSLHPKRIEVVTAYCYGTRGENEGEAFMMGHVKRFKDKGPEITKWELLTGDSDAEGRFPDAIKEGFRLLRKE